jgi:ribonucleoside-diphosphate reductase alpha chain
MKIKIDYSRNKNFSDQALALLKDFYCRTEEDPQEALARASEAYCQGDYEFAQRIYDYASRGWFMFASPVLSNAPAEGEAPVGLPISCFLTFVGDNLSSLIEHNAELAWLSVKGGGVGGHWSDVRGVTDKSVGIVPMLKVCDSQMTAYRQGRTRKGSYAAYLDISHPDMIEFLIIREPTGGDENRKCLNIHNAINISDKFMEAVEKDDDWQLVDPHTKMVTDTISARKLWQRILKTRFKTGEPYLNFIDTANRGLPESQRNLGLKINGSNLCNEIHLATDEQRTAVCCLSSVNLELYDEWCDTGMVKDLVRFLDNVLDFFIEHAPAELAKAVFSAQRERSIGLGAMGFHGYLQKEMIPWESPLSISVNHRLFSKIKEQADEATLELGIEKGEAPDMVGTGRRNAHLLAIAPNANSSIICGCSPSIEPSKSNAFTHRTRAGSHLIKNKYLKKLLKSKDLDTDAVWRSIINNDGSVQHIDALTEWEKDVFKTAFEINQEWVVDLAGDRQEYICQGQSVNLFFPAGSPASYVNLCHIKAFKRHLKGLYYLRTNAGVDADKVGLHVERNALKDAEECVACHG